ncbi:helix-turn-helix domain-containing protein [Tessaracoccus caeni]|uniref:helix-turn-helix domain-containing protein n=1 Tax=Tessaracoccus caeni TaxID=3031239 RepID=UPI0023D983D3|nr:helix-turn-helix domain-containing protein [Tessaracoccus caeni]MDF1489432.1 helix-turn-helix domain-containing protein [Tessaracoccus caeni]
MIDVHSADEARPIAVDERSGVLHPDRLVRFAAGWIDPAPTVSAVVDQYWHVSWALDDSEQLDQRIIDLPAVTLTAEAGTVPAPLVVTGVQDRAWRRTIRGTGDVFAIRLRPAGLAVLSDLVVTSVANRTMPLTTTLDARLHALMSAVAAESGASDRADAANRLIERLLAEHPPTPAGLLANDVLDEMRTQLHHKTGPSLAQRFHCSERTIQRALASTLGHGPKWISRRIRLQEVARTLVTRMDADVASIAADLGYTDHSHLTKDFHAIAGVAPDAYRREVERLR